MYKRLKTTLSLLLFFLPAAMHGHTLPHEYPDTLTVAAPDMAAIKKSVADIGSPYYFPVLMQRYLDGDTTLTSDDYRYLYFGYSFQDDYDPYRTSPCADELDSLCRRGEYPPETCAALLKCARRSLDNNPFDLRSMSAMVHANTLSGQADAAAFWRERLHRLLDAILSTGDGQSAETAWYVIAPEHAYDLLNTLGVMPDTYEFCPPQCDYIGVYDLIGTTRGFYFNVSRQLEATRLKFYPNNTLP